ncbi:MAG: Fis family transcriptional regulator [Spirochaetes bacterium RIFOXYC1_FULL_54_7]|nr:MAG: Fis family transcriptional regulator [Spirochaetes bacterium RIFOXYC1_FULL_54_7]
MTDIILESISDGVFTVDDHWHVTSFNRAAETITGIPRSEAIGKLCHEVFKSNMCETGCPLRMTMKTKKPVIDAKGYCINPSGERIPISVSTALLQDSAGHVLGGAETFRDLRELEELKQKLGLVPLGMEYSSRSPSMKAVVDLVPLIAASKATVLIEGETGTGKEVAARAIHANSPQAAGPFVAVNCGALPDALLESELFGYKKGAFTGADKDKPGRFQQADKGTLFLDEIGDISPAMQVKLLRVLQEGEYEPLGAVKSEKTEARIICATNHNLKELVDRGSFRRDLYYRINVIRLALPPLRERKEDIPDLAEYFLRMFRHRIGKPIECFSEHVYAAFFAYDWPGNIRELENVVERAVILCAKRRIETPTLPQELRQGTVSSAAILPRNMQKNPGAASGSAEASPEIRMLRNEAEADAIRDALTRTFWNHAQAALELGIHRSTLYRKMDKYGIAKE